MLPLALVDYGAGNLASVRKAFRAIGADMTTCATPAALEDVAGIVVPGVGHFGATAAIDDAVREAVMRRIDAGVPLLGICLGMQWLFDGSDEAPDVPSLGVLSGRCTKMAAELPLKVPHVGWNAVQQVARSSSLMSGVADDDQVYFTHSFAVVESVDAVAAAVHGHPFVAAVQREHICGVQFHPEKSAGIGLRVLRNFVRMSKG
jgi:glutamine amidotransferase